MDLSELSTAHALLDVMTFSFENMNDNLLTRLTLSDLANAFVTMCHDIFLSKLDRNGILGHAKDLWHLFLKRKYLYLSMGENL